MQIVLTDTARHKLRAYIDQAGGEISGLGRSVVSPDKQSVIVLDAWIWKQECTGATTEVVDHDAVFDLAIDLNKSGVPLEELNVWWHSHDTMATFFSKTDTDTMDSWENDRFLVSICGNLAKQWAGRVDIKAPIPCYLDGVAVVEEGAEPVPQDVLAQAKKEINEKVKMAKITRGYVARAPTQAKHAQPVNDDLLISGGMEEDARACGCMDCLNYLEGYAEFAWSKHKYDINTGNYVAILQYAR